MDLSPLTRFVTEFGDQAVILPFVITVAAVLLALGASREAAIWCLAIFLSLSGALLAKLVFIPCGHLLPVPGIRSPSGHAAAAIAAYGGFAVLWAKFATDTRLRALFVSAAVLGSLAIAASRIVLGAHTAGEVALGGLIGLAAPLLMARSGVQGARAAPRPHLLLLLLVPLLAALLLHGRTLSVETEIDRFALRLAAWLGICG
jgi:membrane-associated phospholipid phosphatase